MVVVLQIGSVTLACLNIHFPFSKHKSVKLDQATNMLECFLDDAMQRIQILKARLRATSKQSMSICSDTLWIMGADLNTNMQHFNERAHAVARVLNMIDVEIIPYEDPFLTTYTHA